MKIQFIIYPKAFVISTCMKKVTNVSQRFSQWHHQRQWRCRDKVTIWVWKDIENSFNFVTIVMFYKSQSPKSNPKPEEDVLLVTSTVQHCTTTAPYTGVISCKDCVDEQHQAFCNN